MCGSRRARGPSMRDHPWRFSRLIRGFSPILRSAGTCCMRAQHKLCWRSPFRFVFAPYAATEKTLLFMVWKRRSTKSKVRNGSSFSSCCLRIVSRFVRFYSRLSSRCDRHSHTLKSTTQKASALNINTCIIRLYCRHFWRHTQERLFVYDLWPPSAIVASCVISLTRSHRLCLIGTCSLNR